MDDDPSPPTTSHEPFVTITHDSDAAVQNTAPLVRSDTDTPVQAPPLARTCSEDDAASSASLPAADDKTLQSPSTPLRISTEISVPALATAGLARRGSLSANANLSTPRAVTHKASHNSLQPLSRTPSLRSSVAHGFGSAGGSSSAIPSPVIAAMGDMTPLPSPLLSSDSPGPWRRLSIGSGSPPLVRARLACMGQVSVLVTNNGESVESAAANAPKRKMYAAMDAANTAPHPEQPQPQHAHQPKNRSISEYIPNPVSGPKRPVIVSGSHAEIGARDQESQMRRELNYAESRGLTPTVTQPPTPPPSESSRDSSDGSKLKDQGYEYFEARARSDRKMRRWRSIGFLGQGTFSRVILATSQAVPDGDSGEPSAATPTTPVTECSVARRKLVAVKVCEHGPRGGASEERVEMSLKRELEILQSINHPSLVNLKAWSIEPTRAILVLNYSPGGDLFEVATAHRAVLTSSLLRRMFAELVGAVHYLHERRIVHRDIKLENVLVNLSPAELADPTMDWATLPQSVVTLTDLGLSRRVADDEKLETRCGSDDYAAPEVIMGQPYDGRAIDAWSLGVLLYALLEARLPFDPHPGMSDAHRMRSRTSHRIARVEWRWIEYAGEDGDHEGNLAKFEERGLAGAMEITEGLLKRARSRWSVEKVTAQPWVRDAVQVDGGLQFWEEDEAEEV
ncbi:kinase [Hirsutella rhossiliensis]|uniref:Kinase n=1 Tax=Hirsutella rhossiliensis TaxID=111463 RepID=A0A9P8MU28_9HYPO|nr:kinase [Hirsutella rhossiliensis]KAH0961179.1 kinase [Hirsutella rhossiliensis]